MKAVFLIILILSSVDVKLACTGVVMSTYEAVYYGGNEDYYKNYNSYIFIKPGNGNSYGIIGLGLDEMTMQTAVNEKGLCFDGFTTTQDNVYRNKDKPRFGGNLVEYALRTCETVDEVLELFEQYYIPWMASCQLMFGDRFGGSLIHEGNTYIIKKEGYQICTNFYQSINQQPGWRFKRAKELLSSQSNMSFDLLKRVLKETHQEGSVISIYSNIFDLTNGKIFLYRKYNYDEVMEIDIQQEFKKGTVVENLDTYYKVTDVKLNENMLPQSFKLYQNYPNPFNPATTIEFSLPEDGFAELSIFNSIGEKVQILLEEYKTAGEHKIIFNASYLPSGIYYYKLYSKKYSISKKMILLK